MMPCLTHDARLQIVTLFTQGGHTAAELAAEFNCNRRTVNRPVYKYQATASVDDRRCNPHQRVTTECKDRVLVRMSSQSPQLVA